jgi:hypothetical protein
MVATGKPIVYTSADSVLQIAAHEDVIAIDDLYAMCESARAIMTGEHAVGRVIARPFEGTPGAYHRTPRRHDFSVSPPKDTMLDLLKKAGYQTIGVGKIGDIFAGKRLLERKRLNLGAVLESEFGDSVHHLGRQIEIMKTLFPLLRFDDERIHRPGGMRLAPRLEFGGGDFAAGAHLVRGGVDLRRSATAAACAGTVLLIALGTRRAILPLAAAVLRTAGILPALSATALLLGGTGIVAAGLLRLGLGIAALAAGLAAALAAGLAALRGF